MTASPEVQDPYQQARQQAYKDAHSKLLEAEALAHYLKNSDAANDENADVIVAAIAESILNSITPALKLLE